MIVSFPLNSVGHPSKLLKLEGVCGEGWEVRGGDTLARPRTSPGPLSPGLTGEKLRVVGVGEVEVGGRCGDEGLPQGVLTGMRL